MTVSPKLGTRHSLEILKVIRNGLLLDGGDQGAELWPAGEVDGPPRAPGHTVMVPPYSAGAGRPMASLRTPRVQLGQVASLKVVSTSKVGAFVDWGMPKDLLLPFAEQKGPVREESWVLVMLTTDREGRLMVSAQLDRFLSDTCQAYQQGDEVSLVAAHSTDLGYKVVVDDHAWGMIAASELRAPLRPGQRVTGYVQRLRQDQKLSLSLNAPGAAKSDGLTEQILAALEKAGGELPLGDKSSPEAIFQTFRCSKNAFKQAIGGLYKARRIVIEKERIFLSDV